MLPQRLALTRNAQPWWPLLSVVLCHGFNCATAAVNATLLDVCTWSLQFSQEPFAFLRRCEWCRPVHGRAHTNSPNYQIIRTSSKLLGIIPICTGTCWTSKGIKFLTNPSMSSLSVRCRLFYISHVRFAGVSGVFQPTASVAYNISTQYNGQARS